MTGLPAKAVRGLLLLALLAGLSFLRPAPACCADEGRLEQAVDAYLASLSPMQQVSLLFLVNIDGNTAYRALERDEDGSPIVPGGCLFFSYNIAPSAGGVIAFTESIASYCTAHDLPRPYVAVDQEGGSVNRLRDLTSPLPSSGLVAQRLTPQEAAKLYALQGEQMAALGFDLNLAPVAEAQAAYNSDYLGRRAFGGAADAAAYSFAAVRAYQDQGVLCAVKHFPGNSNADPHAGTSVIGIGETELVHSMLLPFSFVLAASPAAVLMSHALVPAVDPASPAVLSAGWMKGILKGQLGYGGLVISDDIFMGAVSSFDMRELSVRAVSSGADVLMLSDKYFKNCALALLAEAGADSDFARRLHEAEEKVVRFKIRAGLLKAVEGADGSLSVVELSLVEQRGSASSRLRTFEKSRRQGEEFYRRHFSGGAQ